MNTRTSEVRKKKQIIDYTNYYSTNMVFPKVVEKELALFKEYLLFNNLFKEFNRLVGGWGYFYNRAMHIRATPSTYPYVLSKTRCSVRIHTICRDWMQVFRALYIRMASIEDRKLRSMFIQATLHPKYKNT